MSEERTQYTTQRYAELESQIADSAPDERTQLHPDIAVRLEVNEKHIKQLTSTIDGMTMVMGRHADTITAQRGRIAELEATVQRLQECSVPVTLLRYIVNSHPLLPVDDRIAASRWLDGLEGDA